MSGACGSSPSRYRPESGVPDASVQARSSRGPGNHWGGTVLTAPLVHSTAIATRRGSTAVRTSGVSSSVRAISARKPASPIISANASARHNRSTTTDTRATRSDALPRRETCPGAASSPVRSAKAGGTDSAEKKDSWLTAVTLRQPPQQRPRRAAGRGDEDGLHQQRTPPRLPYRMTGGDQELSG